jgi:putative membrane protein
MLDRTFANVSDVLFQNATPALLAVNLDVTSLLGALIYSLIGIVLFAIAFFVIVKIAPFSIRKEIEEDQNTSLGIIIAAVILGISMIISAAVQG